MNGKQNLPTGESNMENKKVTLILIKYVTRLGTQYELKKKDPTAVTVEIPTFSKSYEAKNWARLMGYEVK